jgi:hypothetical protein
VFELYPLPDGQGELEKIRKMVRVASQYIFNTMEMRGRDAGNITAYPLG